MHKIKRKSLFIGFWILLIVLLVYTRFVNLGWGLPYPMHPDERNMVSAIQQLNCKFPITNFSFDKLSIPNKVEGQFPNKFQITNIKFLLKDCFNPRFFAYGQFPLYTGYAIVMVLKFFDGDLGTPISFEEAVISLRILSAFASVINVFILLKVIKLLGDKVIKEKKEDTSYSISQLLITALILTFTPFFIQFSHFGTTESLLMLLLSLILFLCILKLENKISELRFLFFCSLACGLAVATKVSSVFFLVAPFITLFPKSTITDPSIAKRLLSGIYKMFKVCFFLFLTGIFTLLFSPHNLISLPEFIGSMNYESDVAFGIYDAFYTKQFYQTVPVLYQFSRIFPYVLGWPALIFFTIGFLVLPWNRSLNLLRIAFVVYFSAHAAIYAKWTRFISPLLPIMLLFATLFLVSMYQYILTKISNIKYQISKQQFKYKKFLILTCNFGFCILLFAFIVPSIAFLSIYQNTDVRFQASEWIYKNIPSGSYILSETANVVDLPVFPSKYGLNPKPLTYISFNLYDLDTNFLLRNQLQYHISKADYIYVPSRRVFANHTCLNSDIRYQISNIKMTNQISKKLNARCEKLMQRYPLLHDYYQKLFSGELGFAKVAEFSSFPSINIFGIKLLEFPDEEAEETWSVFDHPVIRIYKKVSSK